MKKWLIIKSAGHFMSSRCVPQRYFIFRVWLLFEKFYCQWEPHSTEKFWCVIYIFMFSAFYVTDNFHKYVSLFILNNVLSDVRVPCLSYHENFHLNSYYPNGLKCSLTANVLLTYIPLARFYLQRFDLSHLCRRARYRQVLSFLQIPVPWIYAFLTFTHRSIAISCSPWTI